MFKELININKKNKLFIIITAIVLLISNGILLFVEEKTDMFKGLVFSDYECLNKGMYDFDNEDDFFASLLDISDEELQKKVTEFSTNNKWKDIISKKADEITDEEYLALSLVYSDLDYSDIETFLSFCLNKQKQKGSTVYYNSNNKKINKLTTCLHNYYCSWTVKKSDGEYDVNEYIDLLYKRYNILKKLAILYSVMNIKGDIIGKQSNNKPIFNIYEEKKYIYIDYNLSSDSIIIDVSFDSLKDLKLMVIIDALQWPLTNLQKQQLDDKVEKSATFALDVFDLLCVYIYYKDSPNGFYTLIYPSFKTLKRLDVYNQRIGEFYGEINVCDVFVNYDKIDTLLNELFDGKCNDNPSVSPKKQKELIDRLFSAVYYI